MYDGVCGVFGGIGYVFFVKFFCDCYCFCVGYEFEYVVGGDDDVSRRRFGV